MKRIITIISMGMALTSYGQKFFSNVTLTDLIKGKSLFLISTNGTDTLSKCTGAQLLTFVKDSMDVSAIQTQSAPSYVMTIGADGKIARTSVATAGTFGMFSAYASGTAYDLTGSSARVDFGTTDPDITLTTAGTYILYVQGSLMYNGYAKATSATVTIKLRNVTAPASDIPNMIQTIIVPIVGSAYTSHLTRVFLPIYVYTTAGVTDRLQVYGQIDTMTGVTGVIQVTQCSVVAIRLY